MKGSIGTAILLLTLAGPMPSLAQPVAGTSPLGVDVTEMQAVMNGWSAKKTMLGKEVYNDKNEKIGKLEDIIIKQDDTVSFAVLNVGGFLGMTHHLVAVPMKNLKIDNRIVLPGATREELKKVPAFKYAPRSGKR